MMEDYVEGYREHKGIDRTSFIIVSLFVIFFGYVIGKKLIISRREGPYTQCLTNLKNMGTALEMYAEDNNGHYPSELSRITPKYLRMIPTCAAAEKDTYSSAYTSYCNQESKEYRFTVYCQGDAHQWTNNDLLGIRFKTRGGVGISDNYPQYTSGDGLIAK